MEGVSHDVQILLARGRNKPEPEPEPEPEVVGYDELSKPALRALCEQRGLPLSGTKADLVTRLEA